MTSTVPGRSRPVHADFPQLSEVDVREALRFAAAAVDERTLPLRPSA